MSATAFAASATLQYDRNAYVIKVLEAPAGLRETVRIMALESDSFGQQQLVAILTMFEALSDEDKAAFIVAFKGCATIAGQGPSVMISEHAWDPLNIPPYLEP